MMKKMKISAALIASLIAGSAFAQGPTETPDHWGTGTLTRAEVKADLEIWNRAGMNQFSRGEQTTEMFTPRYRQAFSEYVRMRSGAEYKEALMKQQSR